MKNVKIAALLAFVFGLTGCETLMTRGQVREQEQKKQIHEQVVTLQRTTADVNNRFNSIEEDLRSLNGRVESLEVRSNQSGQERERLKAAAEQGSQENSKKIQILQEEMIRMQEQVGALTAELNAMKTAAASAASANSAASKKDSYETAEELFDQKEWRKAILNYQRFRDANPKHKKFSDATYKIGVCFQELGMKDEARTFYDEVVSKFPNSAEAKKAKTRLKSLKK